MKKRNIILFDVDGTLTEPQKEIKKNMENILEKLSKKKNFNLGFVGGSSYELIEKFLKKKNFKNFKYWFCASGNIGYENKKLLYKNSIIKFLGEEKYQILVNFFMQELSKICLPKKRGLFLEFRGGMLNLSPIGRNCSYSEREEFYKFDEKNKIREKLIEKFKKKFKKYNLEFKIGGQISIDIYPKGWDKTFCLNYIEKKYEKIYFFGDKCEVSGNDYTIFMDKRTIAFCVKNPSETIKILKEKFLN